MEMTELVAGGRIQASPLLPVPCGRVVGLQPFDSWPAAETPMCSCCAAGHHLWPLVLLLGQGAPSSCAWRIHVSAEITWQLSREHCFFP